MNHLSGPDKIYYRIGFTDKPILYPGGGDESEGDTADVPETFLGVVGYLYDSLPSCDNTALNLIVARDPAAELKPC